MSRPEYIILIIAASQAASWFLGAMLPLVVSDKLTVSYKLRFRLGVGLAALWAAVELGRGAL